MARKKEFKHREAITVTLEREEKEILDAIRWREHKDIAELARIAIQEYIKLHAEGNDTFTLDNFVKDPAFEIMPTLGAPQEKWRKFYEGSSQKDRMQLRFYINKLQDQISNVEFNENAKATLKWRKKL